MNNIILAIIELLGGMGAFLLGFKVLSESIEKLASAGLKRLFNKTSKPVDGAILVDAVKKDGQYELMVDFNEIDEFTFSVYIVE